MKLISHMDVRGAQGGLLEVPDDAVLTPLAAEEAERLGVQIQRGPGGPSSAVVRQVARQVVAKLGDASPEVMEAVITEVVSTLSNAPAYGEHMAPGLDYCQRCIETERGRSRSRCVITMTGRNAKGIVARTTTRISDLGGDILDIAQTIVGDWFTMIIVVDTQTLNVAFADFKAAIEERVREIGLQAMVMHEDVLNSLHRI
jgi:ACT domain-containing protein